TLTGHTDWIAAIAFSPDGARLASGSADATVRIWDPVGGEALLTLQGHAVRVTGVAFSPDGARLASASGDPTVKRWSTVSGDEALTPTGHTGTGAGLSFSADGWRLASAGYDRTLRVWDARPWTARLRAEQTARNLIRRLYAELGTGAEVTRRIGED